MRPARQLTATLARACAEMASLDPPRRAVDPTRKRLDPGRVPPSCAELDAIRRAEYARADAERAPDPFADLRREQSTPRCLVCNAPLVGGRGGHIYCEEHAKRRDPLYGTYAAPPTAFAMEAYSW